MSRLVPATMATLDANDAASVTWDAVVIGAGPAGAACAIELARREARVLLIERAVFPRAKVCGGCIGPAAVAALDALGARGLLEDAPRVDRAVVVHRGVRAVVPIGPYRVVERARFDAALVHAAILRGAQFLDGAPAMAREGGRVEIRSGGHVHTLFARAVVAADGLAGSALAHDPYFATRVAEASRVGLGAVAPAGLPGVGRGRLVMIVGAEGYLGLVTDRDGAVLAAAAIEPDALRAGGKAGPALAALADQAGWECPESLLSLDWKGTPALSRRRGRLERGNLFVTGDSGAYVEPFTGEGIGWAMAGGIECARGAVELLLGRYTLGAWTRRHARQSTAAHRRCRRVQAALRMPGLVRAAVRGAAAIPGFGAALSWAVMPRAGTW